MNIFYVDKDPRAAAQMLCDKHVVKMVLESAQLICTTAHLAGFDAPYKPTHINHPCSQWVRMTPHNFTWLCDHAKALCAEYTFRYGKTHKSQVIIEEGSKIYSGDASKHCAPSLCMPDTFKCDDPVTAYRTYYRVDKARIAQWRKGRPAPSWWELGRRGHELERV